MAVETGSSRPQSTDFSVLSSGPAFRSPRPDGGVASLDGLSPAMGDSWASMVNTPLLPMFQKPSSSAVNNNNNNATSHGQTVDLATTNLNDLYGAGNVPRLEGSEKFRRSSKGHMHDNTSGGPTAVNNGVTNNGVYGDDGDLISGHRASSRGGSGGSPRNGGVSNWSGAQSLALSNTSGRFGSNDDGSNATAAAARQAALAGLDIGIGGFVLGRLSRPRGHAERAQHGATGPAERDELAEPIQHEHARHGESQRDGHIAKGAAPRSADCRCWRQVWTGWPRARWWTRRIRGGEAVWGGPGRGGPGRSEGRLPGLSANSKNGSSARGGNNNGGGGGGDAKKDEEDFDPAVLNDAAGWLRSLRLHKYTPNFEGMSWKKMVLMDEQAFKAQGVAPLDARRKMLKDFRGRQEENGHQ